MISTEEPRQWPWYARLMFIIIGMVAVPVLLFMALIQHYHDEKDIKSMIKDQPPTKE